MSIHEKRRNGRRKQNEGGNNSDPIVNNIAVIANATS